MLWRHHQRGRADGQREAAHLRAGGNCADAHFDAYTGVCQQSRAGTDGDAWADSNTNAYTGSNGSADGNTHAEIEAAAERARASHSELLVVRQEP